MQVVLVYLKPFRTDASTMAKTGEALGYMLWRVKMSNLAISIEMQQNTG